jgi:dihydropteroate synthase
MVENTNDDLLNQVGKMISDGATFIDIGAYSSKPSAEFVSENEELGRIVPVVQLILKHFPEALLSIDTFKRSSESCIENGAAIINDISAGNLDDAMFEVIQNKVPYDTMIRVWQTRRYDPIYKNIVKEILIFSEKGNKTGV